MLGLHAYSRVAPLSRQLHSTGLENALSYLNNGLLLLLKPNALHRWAPNRRDSLPLKRRDSSLELTSDFIVNERVHRRPLCLKPPQSRAARLNHKVLNSSVMPDALFENFSPLHFNDHLLSS